MMYILHSIYDRLSFIEEALLRHCELHEEEYSDSGSEYSDFEQEYDPDFVPGDEDEEESVHAEGAKPVRQRFSDSESDKDSSASESSSGVEPESQGESSELSSREGYSGYTESYSTTSEGEDEEKRDGSEGDSDESYSYDYSVSTEEADTGSGPVSDVSEGSEPEKPAAETSPSKPAEPAAQKTPTKPAQEEQKESPKKDSGRNVTVVDGVRIVSIPPREGVTPSGEPAGPNRPISIRYMGSIVHTRKVFDQTGPRGQPLTFVVGKGEVIRGLEIGVTGMLVGERRTLFIPPRLGYGTSGSPPEIGPNEALQFNVERVN